MKENNKQKTTENFRKTYKPFLSKIANIQYTQNEYMVYYDSSGKVVLITPEQNEIYDKKYLSTTILFDLVKPVVHGQRSMNDYYVESGELRQKQDVLKHNKEYLFDSDKDSFVEKVDRGGKAILLFDVGPSEIILSVDDESLTHYRRLLDYGLVSEKNLNISGSKYFTFFVADKFDPNMLIDSYDVSVRDLINQGNISLEGDFDWNEMAIYCKQITTTKIRNVKE